MKIQFLTFLAIFAALLSGCYPKGAEYIDELDTALGMYSKQYEKDSSFNAPKEFYLNPKVVYIKDGKVLISDPVGSNPTALLAEVNNQLTNTLDYTAVTPALVNGIYSHDFDVLVTVYESSYTATYWYYNWYSYYWGYYPGGGYGYPVTYTYSVGTCTINFVNPNYDGDAAIADKSAYYMGAVNGLLEGTKAYETQRLKTGLDDLFTQAPFNN